MGNLEDHGQQCSPEYTVIKVTILQSVSFTLLIASEELNFIFFFLLFFPNFWLPWQLIKFNHICFIKEY